MDLRRLHECCSCGPIRGVAELRRARVVRKRLPMVMLNDSLSRRIKEERPDIEVIVVSAHHEAHFPPDAPCPDCSLVKPVYPHVVIRRSRRCWAKGEVDNRHDRTVHRSCYSKATPFIQKTCHDPLCDRNRPAVASTAENRHPLTPGSLRAPTCGTV
jgi:hypothetical protein